MSNESALEDQDGILNNMSEPAASAITDPPLQNTAISQADGASLVDLRLLEYVSDFDRNLVCPICRCPFINPVRLACDHTYCTFCLTRSLHNQSHDRKTCPTCRKPTTNADALPIPRFLLHMVDDLMVKCPKSGCGCDKHLKRSDVQSHIDYYCQFAEVPCPSRDCPHKVPRGRLTEKCLHETVTCEHCNLRLPLLDLETHLERLCTVKADTCKFCQDRITRFAWNKHASECAEAITSCLASSIGCSFTSKRNEIKSHSNSCPLVAILPSMQSMTRRIEDQESALNMLRRKNSILEESFVAMQSLLAEPTANIPPQSTSQRPADPAELSDAPPFDSATHHMLSLHESLREELDRVSAAISEVDGRASMTIINETLRIREELTHTNAVISSMRMQLQWLASARLQAHPRGPLGQSAVSAIGPRGQIPASGETGPSQPTRRLSDSARQDTKL